MTESIEIGQHWYARRIIYSALVENVATAKFC